MPLSQSQKRYLRGLAHTLHPVIMVGNKGVTESLVKELGLALDHHELVKVKLAGADREERAGMVTDLATATTAESVQTIGHTVTLYRRNEKQPKLALPK